MDSKITLSFDKEVIEKARKYAESQNISLSRLTEFLLRRITSGSYKTLEDIQISDWVMQLSEGRTEYQIRRRTRKSMRNEFLNKQK
jgi:hypothetical protein